MQKGFPGLMLSLALGSSADKGDSGLSERSERIAWKRQREAQHRGTWGRRGGAGRREVTRRRESKSQRGESTHGGEMVQQTTRVSPKPNRHGSLLIQFPSNSKRR